MSDKSYYRILSALNADELEKMVRNSIEAGFKPVGGVTIAYVDGACGWHQAVYYIEHSANA